MSCIETKLAIYDYVLKVFQLATDAYFKRTQLIMIVAQSILFIAFVKLFTADTIGFKGFPLLGMDGCALQGIALLVVAILGAISAYIWIVFVSRQRNVLDICRTYLRNIEDSLTELGVVPLGYWKYESLVSHPENYAEAELQDIRSKNPSLFPCWHFPCGNYQKKIGLTGIEQGIAWFLFALWALTAYIIGLSVLVAHSNLSKELDMNTTAWILLIYAVIPTIALVVVCVRTYGSRSRLSKIDSMLLEIQQQLKEPRQTTKQGHETQATEEADTPQT